MKIETHSVVTIAYRLHLDDGEVVESADEKEPFRFIIGLGQTLPAFDAELIGKEAGNAFDFSLSQEDAFGKPDPSMIVDIPRSTFAQARYNALEPLKTLPMVDAEGNTIWGTVVEVGEEFVKMDFNHPLAGETLRFEGTVMSVRRARPSELEMGRPDETRP